jgi:hypothetical protein
MRLQNRPRDCQGNEGRIGDALVLGFKVLPHSPDCGRLVEHKTTKEITMKRGILWHEDCARNWERTLNHKKEEARHLLEAIKADEEALSFYQEQVKTACKRGKDGFDRTKFLVKKIK